MKLTDESHTPADILVHSSCVLSMLTTLLSSGAPGAAINLSEDAASGLFYVLAAVEDSLSDALTRLEVRQ
jgi:hypothetical protein